jgi:cytochrome c peroxidase
MPVPEANPVTGDGVALGRSLFNDPRLSRDGKIACASCHDRDRAFADGRPVPIGVFGRVGRRNAPAILNRGYGRTFFWDGRAPTLEEQVVQPIQDPNEMALTLDEASARVGLPADTIARALASYVRSILSGNSPFDRFVNGDRAALTEQEQSGLRLFRTKGNCTACHVGPTFTDEQFHNTGVAWPDSVLADEGRARVSGRAEHRGAFKTPTLREVARTGPYMHDGSLATLEDVIDYYDRGGNSNPLIDRDLRPLNLSPDEKRSLVAFLGSLSGEVREGLASVR